MNVTETRSVWSVLHYAAFVLMSLATTNSPVSFYTWSCEVHGPRTLRSQTPGQLHKSSLMLNDPRLEGADGAFSPHEASAQLRSPPCIEHLSAAASVAVETELLWSQFTASSCSQAKQSIDPVCHFHTLVSGGWWRCSMCLCHVCGVKEWLGDKVSVCNGWDEPEAAGKMCKEQLHESSKAS